MKKTKTQKGITLVALIITIVVLLILAVVAIGAVQESNIIGHAQNAAVRYNQSKNNEISLLDKYENEIEKYNPSKESEEVIWGEYQGMLIYIGNSKSLIVTEENIKVKLLELTQENGNFIETDEIKDSTFSNYVKIYFNFVPSIEFVDFGNKLSGNNQLLFGKNSQIKEVKGLEGLTSLSFNEMGTFEDCSKLEKIIIPSTVKEIKGHSFNNCIELKNIEIPETVTDIYDTAFNGCTNLATIKIHQDDSSVLGENWIPVNVPTEGIQYLGTSQQ